MEWRDHLPHDCPPSDAKPAKDNFYRLIKSQHAYPCAEDFRSWREDNVEKELPKGITECQACGLSILQSLEDVHRLQRRVPAFRRNVPAMGSLTPDLGRVKHTPTPRENSHHTWWVSKESQPWEFFKLVDTAVVQS